MINISQLNYAYNDRTVLEHINLYFENRQFYGIVGPNGSGKTTLLKLIAKILKPSHQTIFISGQDLLTLKEKKRAKEMAMVPQIFNIDLAFTVEEIVSMGRYPYMESFSRLTEKDHLKIREALRQTNLLDYRLREVNTLSGGELQRVILARAIVQETKLLLLDEPLSHLDIHHQLEILQLTKHLCEKDEKTVLCVMHDLNLAMKYCDQVILLKDGHIFASGKTTDVLTKENIHKVYGIEVTICQLNGQTVITY